MADTTTPATGYDVGIYSWGSSPKAPGRWPATQYEFDLSAFRDPKGNPSTRLLNDGLDNDVVEFIKQDPRYPGIEEIVEMLVSDYIDGKRGVWITFGFRDYHGTYISPAVAEAVRRALTAKGYRVYASHVSLAK